MDWINYHHLLYFWVVAREGSVVRACEELQLSQPTISGQLTKFEKSLRCKLFRRAGRGLELTEEGRMLFRYADEIFTIGREMVEAMKGRATGRPLRFTVGVADVLPKLVVYRLLEPACRLDEPIELVCHEGKLDSLLADLALFNLDVVLSEAPVSAQTRVRAFIGRAAADGVAGCGRAAAGSGRRGPVADGVAIGPGAVGLGAGRGIGRAAADGVAGCGRAAAGSGRRGPVADGVAIGPRLADFFATRTSAERTRILKSTLDSTAPPPTLVEMAGADRT
jgi:DNA-binding transcriptional LysR family regulator